ncbi:MAG: hypothetical protein K8R88_06545 [Armatimonadetes bacterium]|nr:hypothetical protein [Armatimonadota bacterium]
MKSIWVRMLIGGSAGAAIGSGTQWLMNSAKTVCINCEPSLVPLGVGVVLGVIAALTSDK